MDFGRAVEVDGELAGYGDELGFGVRADVVGGGGVGNTFAGPFRSMLLIWEN